MSQNPKIDELIEKSKGLSKRAVSAGLFLKRGIKTDDGLRVFLDSVLGTRIPDRVNCRDKAHKSPFRFISDLFLRRIEDALVHANRSGGKSFNGGLLTWLRSVDPLGASSTRLLGGSADQAEKSYEAFATFWDVSRLKSQYVVGDVLRAETRLKSGVKVQILTASTKSVRGPHDPNLIIDELEEVEEKVFTAAKSQPQSKGKAKASAIYMSTQHKTDGLMAELLEDYHKMGLTLYKWCIFEVLASCRDYNCSTCPISSICPGEQMKTASGYYSIDDFEKKMHQLDEEDLAKEWLCQKPEKRHLVYSKFDEDRVVDCPYNPGLPISGLSSDWGGVDPFVKLVWQRVPELGDVIVDEVYRDNIDNQTFIALCRGVSGGNPEKPWWRPAKGRPDYCDPSRQDLIREWKDAGTDARGVRSLLDDISLVRTKIAPLRGKPSLYVHKDCKRTIWEFGHYKNDKHGKPVDRHNHCMDPVRYFVRGTKGFSGERPQVRIGRPKSLLFKPLDQWPLFRKER